MAKLQATWAPEHRLFFWTDEGALDRVVECDVPLIASLPGEMTRRSLVCHGKGRSTVAGYEVRVGDALPVLASIREDSQVSDSILCWSFISKLALELATAQRAVPTTTDGRAHWVALLARDTDRARFEAVVAALPPSGHAFPTSSRGKIRLFTARTVVRDFLDTAMDELYRQGAHPGSTRGWALQFARALRGPEEREFQPRDARDQGVPGMLQGWTADIEVGGLRLAVGLELPKPGSAKGLFKLCYWVHPEGKPKRRVPIKSAWKSGKSLTIQGKTYPQPATAAITGLARMARVYPPLRESLEGHSPKNLSWRAQSAWDFIANGAPLLREAGFEVILPEDFSAEGCRRIRARMRIDATGWEDGELELSSLLRFQWEVVLGDRVLSGAQFTELLAKRSPVVRFDGDWVLLDPAELAKLPQGLPQEGELEAAVALRAVLMGQLNGVEVVADGRLEMIVDALRSPPDVAPPVGLKGTLRPYQQQGLNWLTVLGQLGLGACLADDMGLGKTIQLISHILRRREKKTKRPPCLVVCPTSVLGNWKREIQKFAPSLQTLRYHGSRRDTQHFDRADVVLTTYGLLVRDKEVLSECSWDVIALDEAQSIKNPSSRRAVAARALTGRHRVALTGTPVENRLDELWSLMEFLVPGMLGPRASFRRNVAVPVERFGDQEIAHRLKLGVSPFLLRRLKTDSTIINDLPDKFETVDYCSLSAEQASLYKQVVDEAMDTIAGSESNRRRGHVLAMLTALKQVCNHPVHYQKDFSSELSKRSGKLERFTEILDNILEVRERALIFTQYKEMGMILQRHLLEIYEEEIPFLHGGVAAAKRDRMVEMFQTDPTAPPFLIISLRAGGTGLNLTAASHVIHYDRWWNPAVEDQATDRAYRIGQHNNVHVHKMVTQGTLEERIDVMLNDKRKLAKSVVGSGENWIGELDNDALRALVMLGEDAMEEL